jgi:hypothetical protein
MTSDCHFHITEWGEIPTADPQVLAEQFSPAQVAEAGQ